MKTTKELWEQVYAEAAADEVSWYQMNPGPSLRLIEDTGLGPAARVLDVGGGTSFLVDRLVDSGQARVGVLDLSRQALAVARKRLGERATEVEWFEQDVRDFEPTHAWDIWHDRAVFHFLTTPQDRAAYCSTLARTLAVGRYTVVATFGPDGPERCSGLPTMRYDEWELFGELGGEPGPGLALRDSFLEMHRTPEGKAQQFLFCRFERVA